MTEIDIEATPDKKLKRGELEKQRRAERMALALRENLRKRKTLQRAKIHAEEEKKEDGNESPIS